MRALALLLGLLVLVPATGAGLAQAPLPDRETFFAEVSERLVSNWVLQNRFTYKERSTDLRFNPFGRIGTGPRRVAQVFPSPESGLTYRRVIERDGRPVPPSEIAAQDRDFLERYRKWQRELAREGRSEREARLRREEEERREDAALAKEALGLLDFTIERREMYESQPAIVISFTPRDDGRPRTREGRIVKSFAGNVWVHEHEFQVMRVDATAVSDTTFGYGVIGRLHEGAMASFLRRKIHGTWLPVENRFKGTGRALLFRKFSFDYERVFYDYAPWDPMKLPEVLGDASPGSR